MKVLIVDDDKLARTGIMTIMDWAKHGFQIVGDVQNGKKALEFLKEHQVDIVFTDIDMPEINGLELMEICKKSFPEVSFVVFSVYEDFSYAQAAIRLDALDYISKIQFETDQYDFLLERIKNKYIRRMQEKGYVDHVDIEDLERSWLNTEWLFNENKFEELCRRTKSIGIRGTDRIFIKCFHNLSFLLEETVHFPSLNSTLEMLDWVTKWKEELFAEKRSVKGEIGSFIKAIRYIEEHLDRNIKADEIAERIGMSRSYLSTRFKDVVGDTVHSYVIRRKMIYAAGLLKDTEFSITAVGGLVGFDDTHYFTKVFEKQHGVTPMEYRKQYGK